MNGIYLGSVDSAVRIALNIIYAPKSARSIFTIRPKRSQEKYPAKKTKRETLWKLPNEQLNYPLVDFTSSGLTHAYDKFSGEENPYRIGEVVFAKSFGLLQFDFENHQVNMSIRGDGNKVLQSYQQSY